MHRDTTFRVFATFDEENEAEHRRLAALSPQARLRELAVIQRRRWGEGWTTVPIVKTASWEKLAW